MSALDLPISLIALLADRRSLSPTKVAQTRYGVPVREITIVSRVSYAGFDLKTQQGAAELEKRIRAAATSSCKEMDVKFPVEGYGDADCIKHAVEGGMSQANKIIAEKGGAAPK